MQASSTFSKAFFCIVLALNQPHEFTHSISVEPWWSKCVGIRGHDSGWKDDKVGQGRSHMIALAGEHRVNTGVEMVVRNRVDGAKATKIVLVWQVISVPCHNIEWGVRGDLLVETGTHFCEDVVWYLVLTLGHDAGGFGILKITRIGEAVASDRAQFR